MHGRRRRNHFHTGRVRAAGQSSPQPCNCSTSASAAALSRSARELEQLNHAWCIHTRRNLSPRALSLSRSERHHVTLLFFGGGGGGGFLPRKLRREKIYEHAPWEFEPGTTFAYNSFHLQVAGAMAAKAANTSVRQLIDNLFEKAGMNHSGECVRACARACGMRCVCARQSFVRWLGFSELTPSTQRRPTLVHSLCCQATCQARTRSWQPPCTRWGVTMTSS